MMHSVKLHVKDSVSGKDVPLEGITGAIAMSVAVTAMPNLTISTMPNLVVSTLPSVTVGSMPALSAGITSMPSLNVNVNVLSLASTAVQFAAASRVLGRGTAGAGGGEELALSSDYGLAFTFAASSLKINTPQDLQTTATPTFANLNISNASSAVAIGKNVTASGSFSVCLGAGDSGVTYANPDASATAAVAIGAGAVNAITETSRINGVLLVAKDEAKTPYHLFHAGAEVVIMSAELNFLGAATDLTDTLPTGVHFFWTECGVIVTDVNLDGGTITTQPTVRFGSIASPASQIAASLTTLLTAKFQRERFTSILDPQTGYTGLSGGMTVAGAITGGGGAERYKGRFYWKGFVVTDE